MPTLKNAKHEAVLAAYIADRERVGWRAYQSVYPKSAQRASETAWSRLLKDAEFKARHDELLASITDAAKSAAIADLEEVLTELTKLGRSNIQNIVVEGDDTGDVVQALRDMAPEHAATIKALTVESYVEGQGEAKRNVKKVKVELHDKRGALHELRAHYEPQRHELTGKDGKAIEIDDVAEKPGELEIARRIAFLLEIGARQAAKAGKGKAGKPAGERKKG